MYIIMEAQDGQGAAARFNSLVVVLLMSSRGAAVILAAVDADRPCSVCWCWGGGQAAVRVVCPPHRPPQGRRAGVLELSAQDPGIH